MAVAVPEVEQQEQHVLPAMHLDWDGRDDG
jgi:hypothetical protein